MGYPACDELNMLCYKSYYAALRPNACRVRNTANTTALIAFPGGLETDIW